MGQREPVVDVEHLCAKSFVRHAELFDKLGSTNNRAAKLAVRPDVPTPALVVARLQTAGRGRGANTWWAAEGALTFSLVLDTSSLGLTPRDWPRLSLTTAIAVCDAVQAESTEQEAARHVATPVPSPRPPSPCSIKWPNDVLLDGRKVCGILIESPGGTAPSKDRLIVGVGINVNNSWQSAPQDAGPDGTALCDVTGRQHELQQVLLALLRALDVRLQQLAAGDPQLPQAWQQLDWLIEQDIAVENNGKRIEGKAAGVADDGALIVESLFGPQRVYSGTVLLVS